MCQRSWSQHSDNVRGWPTRPLKSFWFWDFVILNGHDRSIYYESKIAVVDIGLDKEAPSPQKLPETSEEKQIVKDQRNKSRRWGLGALISVGLHLYRAAGKVRNIGIHYEENNTVWQSRFEPELGSRFTSAIPSGSSATSCKLYNLFWTFSINRSVGRPGNLHLTEDRILVLAPSHLLLVLFLDKHSSSRSWNMPEPCYSNARDTCLSVLSISMWHSDSCPHFKDRHWSSAR